MQTTTKIFQRESFTPDLFLELGNILKAQYDEIYRANNSDLPFDPAVEQYFQLEQHGFYRFFVARIEGKPVAFWGFLIIRHPYSRSAQQVIGDFLGVIPEYRKKGLATDFIPWCLSQIQQEQLGPITQNVPIQSKFLVDLLKKHGFIPINIGMRMEAL